MAEITVQGNNVTIYFPKDLKASDEEAQKFIRDYQAAVAKVDIPTSTLFIDGSELRVANPELTDGITQILQEYKNTGFGRVVMKLGTSAVFKMQVRRLAKQIGFDHFEIVD